MAEKKEVIIPLKQDERLLPLLPPPPPPQKREAEPKKEAAPKPKATPKPKPKPEATPTQTPILPDKKAEIIDRSSQEKKETTARDTTQTPFEQDSVVDNHATVPNDSLFAKSYVDEMPMFPGGMTKLLKYVHSQIKYPAAAQKDSIEGVVTATFIIDEKGNPAYIYTGDSATEPLGHGCEEEVRRILRGMPAWTPGKKNGQPVPVKCVIQISFELD